MGKGNGICGNRPSMFSGTDLAGMDLGEVPKQKVRALAYPENPGHDLSMEVFLTKAVLAGALSGEKLLANSPDPSALEFELQLEDPNADPDVLATEMELQFLDFFQRAFPQSYRAHLAAGQDVRDYWRLELA